MFASPDMYQVDRYGEIKGLELEDSAEFSPYHHIFATIKWVAGIVWLVLVIMLRAHTRQQYAIPATCCSCKVTGNVDFEDIICSFFCQPCSLAQMATHTGAVRYSLNTHTHTHTHYLYLSLSLSLSHPPPTPHSRTHNTHKSLTRSLTRDTHSNESPCDCCDTEDPGPSDAMALEPLTSTDAPPATNSMDDNKL